MGRNRSRGHREQKKGKRAKKVLPPTSIYNNGTHQYKQPASSAKKKKFYLHITDPEEIWEIALETFGGKYYCIGDKKNDQDLSEQGLSS